MEDIHEGQDQLRQTLNEQKVQCLKSIQTSGHKALELLEKGVLPQSSYLPRQLPTDEDAGVLIKQRQDLENDLTIAAADVNSADSQLKDLSNIGVELAGIFRERVMLGQVISSIAKPKELGSLVQLNGELKDTRRLKSLVEYLKISISSIPKCHHML